jgi:hypothetical protein
MKKMIPIAAAAVLASTAVLTTAGSASASQDTSCMQAGLATLRSAGLLPSVAKSGLPLSTALAVGVKPRAGADISGVPNPIPLPLLLADHRAGSNSLFVYPWC